MVTDTSCTNCTFTCHKNSPTCTQGWRSRHLALLDTQAKILYRLGEFRTNVDVRESLFVDLHPKFSPEGNEQMIELMETTWYINQWVIDVSEVYQYAAARATAAGQGRGGPRGPDAIVRLPVEQQHPVYDQIYDPLQKPKYVLIPKCLNRTRLFVYDTVGPQYHVQALAAVEAQKGKSNCDFGKSPCLESEREQEYST